jgi:signal transduction histidine kinase/ActR/RegA family two-component response regulator
MPSPLTILFIAIAAVLCHNGLNYAFSLRGQRKDPLQALFALLCLLGAGYALAALAGYRAVDVPGYLYATKWQTTFSRLILMVLPWFVGVYSDFRPKRFLTALSAGFFLLGVANLVSDHGILFSEITGLVHHQTPWGEQLAAVSGTVSLVTHLAYATDLVTIAFCGLCGLRLLRRGDRSRAWRLLGLVGFAMVAFVNDTLLDAGRIRSVYLEEYVIVAFLLVIGTWLGARRIRAESNYRTLQAQMQQMQKLESLGLLAGGVAHDFNNLLTAVLGNAELALKDLPASAPAREPMVEIRTIACRAADLCRQLLAYSGRSGFASEAMAPQQIVKEISRILEVSVAAKAHLVFRFADDVPLIVGDPTQIRQVVMNLITNASEAIGDKEGVVTLSLSKRQIERSALRDFVAHTDVAEGTYVELAVTDTGCGMDEATRSRVFEPFFSTKFTGRGLGMAAVLGIVRGHKGAIRIASEVGMGTTVTVLLPAAGPEVSLPTERTPSGPAAQPGNAAVLVVDDNARVLQAVSQLVGALGYPVMTAASGREALGVFGEHRAQIGCVLLDLTMPVMDGLETMRALRAVDPKARIVLSSGYSERSLQWRMNGDGPTRFLQKPFVEDDLRAALESAMRASGDRSE